MMKLATRQGRRESAMDKAGLLLLLMLVSRLSRPGNRLPNKQKHRCPRLPVPPCPSIRAFRSKHTLREWSGCESQLTEIELHQWRLRAANRCWCRPRKRT